MKFLIIFILSILTFQSVALEREIVVLTSIKTAKKQPFWRSKKYQISKDVEKQFQGYFKDSGYKLVIKHEVDREILSHHLQSPKTIALFWLSHAADEASDTALPLASIIQDYDGNNVKNVFQEVNPNLQFLGVIGCNALPIFEKFQKLNLYKKNLKLHSYDYKITVNSGIKKAIISSATILDQDPKSLLNQLDILSEDCFNNFGEPITCYRNKIVGKQESFNLDNVIQTPKIDGIHIQVTNSNPEYSGEITIDRQFVAVLKKGTRIQKFIVPNSYFKSRTFELLVNYDRSVLKVKKYMSPLLISSKTDKLNIDILMDKRGNIYGLNENYYNISY